MTKVSIDYRRLPRPGQNGSTTKRGSLNFDRFAAEGNRFINEVALELDVNRNSAARITRAVLHAVRDRLAPDDAVQFAQGLPMALKGVYFDQYDISDTPVIIRHADEFIDYVVGKNKLSADADFPNDEAVIEALRAVFRVLEAHMDEGQVREVKILVGKEIRNLLA